MQAESETMSSSSAADVQVSLMQQTTAVDSRGKHRIQAEVKRLEQETRFLEEELEALEEMEKVSAMCQELLRGIEDRPDPLLPITIGPAITTWDRWFEGPQDPQGCRCWIL
ncbi:Guanine nucleotide-binding protein subunit gamma 2 [Acorus calamus]|uniref:Guanine nucleotide-binding protein subunit gamma 2 n=1 Tax=Acorus calamus TaxID=4465 RepID=A0AAV9CGR5_ACOCL|nr:Guanine nucleotide-binding protein subunit gamma 2 [Acorus calamus]